MAHIICRKEDGYYVCGNNSYGQLALGNTQTKYDLTKLSVTGIKRIIPIENTTYVLKEDNSLWACGENGYCQVNSSSSTRSVTTLTKQTTDVLEVLGGYKGCFIVKADGVYARGWNTSGQLGINSTNNGSNYTKVSGIASNEIKKLYATNESTFILKRDNTLWATGLNTSGQLGLGTTTNVKVFTQVPDMDNVKEVYVGYQTTLVLKNDGTLWGCGKNDKGQLGFGNSTALTSFAQIPDMTNIKDVWAGTTVYVLKNDGTLWGCGGNDKGQLGLGNTVNKNTFIQILDEVKEIKSKSNSIFAIKTDGSVVATGYAYNGVLGIESEVNFVNTFTPVVGLDGVDIEQFIPNNACAVKDKNGNIYECGEKVLTLTSGTSLFYAYSFTNSNETALEIITKEGVKFLIKSEDKYYTVKNEVLEETTADDFIKSGVAIRELNTNINLLPSKFKLITNNTFYKSIILEGLAKNKFMAVYEDSKEIPEAVSIANVTIKNSTIDGGIIKVLLSADGGQTYYTIKDGEFQKVPIVIPSGFVADFTEAQKEQWEEAKDVILENGIDLTSGENVIDFSKFGLTYKRLKFKYAIVMKVDGTESKAFPTSVGITYKQASS